MTDPSPYPDHSGDAGAGPDHGSPAGASRWVSKAGIFVAIGLLLLIVVLHLTGVIGPGLH